VVSLVTPDSRIRLEMIRKAREQELEARKRLARIKHKVAVMSGKGGVGKSFVAASLAVTLAAMGKTVGILDADFHGPSIPKLLGVKGKRMLSGPPGLLPVTGPLGVKVVSIDFLLPSEESPVIWRGPLKAGALRELLSMVVWGDLDYLIVDLPPGTGDEPLSVAQLVNDLSGAVIVTIPSDLSRVIVKKAVAFAQQLNLRVLGIVENMSYFVCPKCGSTYRIFGEGAGRRIAEEMGVDFLGEIPLDPRVAKCSDEGKPFVLCYPDSEVSIALRKIVEAVVSKVEGAG